ncbi:MAG: TetR/AcrR family transcriptional regulator [Pseudomonadota bacterium]
MTEAPVSPSEKARTDRILKSASDLFAQQGFEHTKLADVATAADVAVGTIYLRYAGKAELLGAVLSKLEDGFCEEMTSGELWEVPFPKRFEHIMARIMRYATTAENLGPLMAMAPYAVLKEGRAGDKVRSIISAHLSDGVEKGQLRQDLDTDYAAVLAHGMVEGAMIDHMMTRRRSADEVAQYLADVSQRWLCP